MHKILKSFTYLFIILFGGVSAIAQTDSITYRKYISSEAIPEVIEPKRTNTNPDIVDTVYIEPSLNYNIIDKQVETKYEVIKINAAKIKGEPLTKLYNSHIKLGGGNRNSLIGELYYNNGRSKSYNYGGSYKHYSSKGEIKTFENSDFFEDNFNLYGKKFYSNSIVSTKLFANRNSIRHYGYDPYLFDFNGDDIKQRYFSYGAEIGHQTLKRDTSKLFHDVNLKYVNLFDINNNLEHNILLTGKFKKNIEGFLATLDFYTDYYNNKAIDTSNIAIISLNPKFSVRTKKVLFDIGYHLDFLKEDNLSIHHFPDLNISCNIIGNYLIIYLGTDAQSKQNSYLSIINENPFANPNIPRLITKETTIGYAGLKGIITSNSSFNLHADYSRISNLPLYVIDTKYSYPNNIPVYPQKFNTFTFVYDTIKKLTLNGELSYQSSEKLMLLLKGEYNFYELNNEKHAWYLPELEISFSGVYNLSNKLITKLDIFFIDGQYIKYPGYTINKEHITDNKLNPIIDVNLSTEYRYSKKLSAFIKLYNIASQKYYRWNNYQMYGITILGGLTYSF